MLIDRLIARIKELHAPIVVGLDPRLEQIPHEYKQPFYSELGKTPKAAAGILTAWGRDIIDAVDGAAPAIKPQIAMYEQFGPPGIKAYIKTIAYAKSRGLIVIGDIKRGDIASTAQSYADGHIGLTQIDGESRRVFDEDFITLSPYMGEDSIAPYLKPCAEHDRGLFILVKTSNPGSAQIQDTITREGQPLYMRVGQLVSSWGESFIGNSGFSAVGAVVGATHPKQAADLRKALPHTFFLVPGYGAQGATAQDLKGVFNKDGIGGIVNSSRGITGAWASPKYSRDFPPGEFAQAARAALLDMRKDLESAV